MAARTKPRPRRKQLASDQIGASAIAATGRGVLHYPFHKLVNFCARKYCGTGAHDGAALPGFECRTSKQRDRHPQCALKTKNPSSSPRPSSRAAPPPPPLTFGLPGKQRVNLTGAERVLACSEKALSGNVRISVIVAVLTPTKERGAVTDPPPRVFPRSRSGPSENRQNRFPAPSAPSDKAKPW